MSFSLALSQSSTKLRLERFLKKVAGRTDIEDALKRLDRLTQEEARMALAEVLKITHTVREVVLNGAQAQRAARQCHA